LVAFYCKAIVFPLVDILLYSLYTGPTKSMSKLKPLTSFEPKALFYKVDLTVEEIRPANRRYFRLEEMQRLVGGLIQIIPLDGEGLEDKLLVVNEEGKNANLPVNLFATLEWIKYYGETDFVSGDAIICHPNMIR